ncbi:hypothetical protein [Persephonella sp.]|uniref:hypothetical protein n=1 Tax=Persephonella sp. TaxID=2060922 RepID=UPI0025D716D8|nr:hypothetical protein [Persephonella sp.]
MKVQNLVFNRLGNNVSVLIEYPDINIQILDQISFNLRGLDFEVSSISIENNSLKAVMSIKSDKQNKKISFLFTEKELIIDQLGSFLPSEEGFTGKIKNPEILFKAGVDPEITTLFSEDQLFIPQKDFFKSIAKLFAE